MKAIELIKIIEKVKEGRYRSNFAVLSLPFDSLTFEQNFNNYINSLIELEIEPLCIRGRHQLISIKDKEILEVLEKEVLEGVYLYMGYSEGFRFDYYFNNREDAEVAANIEWCNEDVEEVIIVENDKVVHYKAKEEIISSERWDN